ncbi:MAG: methyltransferase [Nitrosomonas sp.]
MLPAISFAAVPADVTTAITTAATDVATVGAAVIIVMVGIKVWKWIQRAL